MTGIPDVAPKLPDRQTVAARLETVAQTLRCPYCESRLKKWAVPQHIWTDWPNEYFYICFNDECPYFVRGQSVMSRQSAFNSYRLRLDPLSGACGPIPVFGKMTLRDGIIDD